MMAYSILDLRYHRNGADEHVYPVIGRGNQAGACHKAGADPSG